LDRWWISSLLRDDFAFSGIIANEAITVNFDILREQLVQNNGNNTLNITPEARFDLLREVLDRFDELVDTFPSGLDSAVIRSYSRYDYNSPGLLSLAALPFWVGERFSQPYQVCMQMAVGNLFLLHCFQSFDFIVDNDRPDTSVRSQVVLGNLSYQMVMRHYQPFFPSTSPFWERVQTYWKEWAESILWEVEQEGHRRAFVPEKAEEHMMISAHKAAALKICPTGLALLADQQALIPSLEAGIDWMHATMQLLDDLTDWREDLQHCRYNAFLGLLVADGIERSDGHLTGDCSPVSSLVEAQVFQAINTSDILERYADIIVDFVRRGRVVIDPLQIKPWSMLMDGLAIQGPWLAAQVKDGLEGSLLDQLAPVRQAG
jgi:hypothetical protein